MRTVSSVVLVGVVVAITRIASAGDLSKEHCLDAHSRGQDAKEAGKLAVARTLFLTCAQASCPAAVQADCARFVDDLTTLQPTIVLVARDGNGHDLPDTSVYIDGVRVASSLDGKPVEIDPGRHTVRFTRGGRDELVTIVIGSGEKGRTVHARFGAPATAPPPHGAFDRSVTRARASERTTHPGGSLAIALTGGGLALGGAAIALYGSSRIPSSCSLTTTECAAAPGDPVFDKAARGATIVNVGLVTGAVGMAALVGGLTWYFAGATTERATQVAPIVTHDTGGIAVSGRF